MIADSIGANPPFRGEVAGPALGTLSFLSFNRTIDFVEHVDYGQLVAIALSRPSSVEDSGTAGLLDVIRIWPNDGPDLVDRRDFSELLRHTASSYELQMLTELAEAGLISVQEVAGPAARHVKVGGPFAADGWHRARAREARSGGTLASDGLELELTELIEDQSRPVPRQFAEIDRALSETYGFGVSQLFTALATIEDLISNKGDFVLLDPHSLHTFVSLLNRRKLNAASTEAVVDFITVPFKYEGDKRRHRFRYGLGWSRPLFEMPPGWLPSAGPHMRIEGGLFNPSKPPHRLLATGPVALTNARRVWCAALLDGEWLHADTPSPVIKEAFRNRRSWERPVVEFESEVAVRLRGLGLEVHPNLPMGAACDASLGMRLRNEIDVLALDAATQTILVVEAKDQCRCLTVDSVKTRLREYATKYEPKLDRKVEDVTGGLVELSSSLRVPLSTWKVRGVFMTRHVDPASFDGRLRYPVIAINEAHMIRRSVALRRTSAG